MFKKTRLSLQILLTVTCAGYLTSTTPTEARSKKSSPPSSQSTKTKEKTTKAKDPSSDRNRFFAYCSENVVPEINCKDLCSNEGNQTPNCLKGCRQGLSVVQKFCDSLNTKTPETRKTMKNSCAASLEIPCRTACQMKKLASATAAKEGYAMVVGVNTPFETMCDDLGKGSTINAWARKQGIHVPS